MADDVLDELIHSVDLDGLVRLIDDRAGDADWEGLDRVRRRCVAATRETGRQLWPAATLSEYRLALSAPPEWVAAVLDGEAGRFTIGPLSEVAAVNHSWAELAPHLEPLPVSLFVAHERSIRGEPIDPATLEPLPPVLDIPVARQPWEPDYPISNYTAEGAEHPEPERTMPTDTVATTPGAERLDDDDAELAFRQLVEPWTAASTGRAEMACVDGDHLAALGALGLATARVVEIPAVEALADLAWAGASGGAQGRRRGMAAGRFSMWWLLGALGDLHDDWPPTADDIADLLDELTWYRWDAHEPPGGWRLQLAATNHIEHTAWVFNATDQ